MRLNVNFRIREIFQIRTSSRRQRWPKENLGNIQRIERFVPNRMLPCKFSNFHCELCNS